MLNPEEIVEGYVRVGKSKAEQPLLKMTLLALLAGLIVALGGVTTNSLAATIDNPSLIRLVAGLLFPFCLAIIILIGAELFTGNCLIAMSVLSRQTAFRSMLYNWLVVYLGNLLASFAVAAALVFSGQMDYAGGQIAVYSIKLAAYKCSLPFSSAFIFGIFCNILVCLGVLCSFSARDTLGKIAGAYLPVAFFVICGFEHSVANMYYIPAGLFALKIPQYTALALDAGINTTSLTWASFLLKNLLPVSLGNLIGGLAFGCLMWLCFRTEARG
ncbi:MAG: formate/nitrite transporter family protein [Clostridiales bacterium]|jgi:formate/nitrite transporter|nr:formate/nitrite transporter family protein [Clostridiales bacterium]